MYPPLADGLCLQLLGLPSESHRLSGLNNRECVSHSLQARSVRSRCRQSRPSAVSHPSWQTAIFALHRHRDFSLCVSVPLLLFSRSVVPGSLQPWGLQHARKTQSFQYVTFSRLVLQIKSNPNQNSNKAFCTH